MPYTSNKNMPKIRREAVRLVSRGWSARKVGRYLGFNHTTIMTWVKIARKIGDHPIPTRSSRPKISPNKIDEKLRRKIVELRIETNRCTEAIHIMLVQKGIRVSKNTVHRVLERSYLLKKRSPWKRYHPHQERPYPVFPGALVETDTIHRMISEKKRLYVFTCIDVYSRWTYAKAYERMNAATAVHFIVEAQKHAPFRFQTIQSDHGPEFGMWFVSRIKKTHRYTRIGKPNDNAHIERFNRTLQEECLDNVLNDVSEINCALRKYLRYYNHTRIHLSLEAAPMTVVRRC